MAGELNFSNEIFSNFAFYTCVVLLKLLFLGLLTTVKRITKGVFANPEDCKRFGDPDKLKPIFNDAGVERVRRNHLNDLENIPAFIFAGLLYVLTGPDPSTALWHFRVFAAARILHTLVYQLELQPWRAIMHVVCLTVTMSMLVQVLMVAKY